MTIVYPYPVAHLSDILRLESVVWDIQRNDEMSGDGGGSVWQAELAPPLWTATVGLIRMDSVEAKRIAAKIRKLHGMQEAFFLVDPLSPYPAADPGGLILGNASVTIAAIANDRDALSLSGLPGGYRLTEGDKIMVAYGADPTRYAFLEIAEAGVASGAGTTPSLGVFPHIPVGVSAGLVAVLAKPACRVVILPGTHNPGTGRKISTEGAGFRVIQKR